MATDEECLEYAASACGLPDLRLITSFRNSFFKWRATGWPKPCTSVARMRLRSNLLHRRHPHAFVRHRRHDTTSVTTRRRR
jgi:hypothetical protein